MKRNSFYVFVLLLQFCSPEKKADSVEEKIKQVETGLINPVYLEGDSTWTIEERMKHYHVPGVSIAVINDGKIEWAKVMASWMKRSKNRLLTKRFSSRLHKQTRGRLWCSEITEEGKIDLSENVNTYLKNLEVARQ